MVAMALSVLEDEKQRNELSEIYSLNIDKFYSIAYSLLHNKQDAEDAVEEAFLSVAEKPDMFFSVQPEKRVLYLNAIIRNVSFRIWKNNHRFEYSDEDPDDSPGDEDIPFNEAIPSKRSCEEIYAFMDTLSEPIKSVMYLKANLNMKYSDIASILGITEETARQRASRAAKKIKLFLEETTDE